MTEHEYFGTKFMNSGRVTCLQLFERAGLPRRSPPPFLPGTESEFALEVEIHRRLFLLPTAARF